MVKPRLGIFSLTGCGGDQLMILNMENQLFELLDRFYIVDFQIGSSIKVDGSIDIALVEGSVSTKNDLKRLKEIRKRSKTLIALGNCAIDGCIQAIANNRGNLSERIKEVYGVEPNFYDALDSKGIGEYVQIDYFLPGCPVEKKELLSAITSLLHGDSPLLHSYPVCVECKLNEYPCVIIEKNLPCLGPVVSAGCDARCPGLGLDCIGCRGPVEKGSNIPAEYKMLLDHGFNEKYILSQLKLFCGNVDPNLFRGAE